MHLIVAAAEGEAVWDEAGVVLLGRCITLSSLHHTRSLTLMDVVSDGLNSVLTMVVSISQRLWSSLDVDSLPGQLFESTKVRNMSMLIHLFLAYRCNKVEYRLFLALVSIIYLSCIFASFILNWYILVLNIRKWDFCLNLSFMLRLRIQHSWTCKLIFWKSYGWQTYRFCLVFIIVAGKITILVYVFLSVRSVVCFLGVQCLLDLILFWSKN